MNIWPSIDIYQNACVRLERGEFGTQKTYNTSPLSQAKEWANQGSKQIHIVDLDGAKNGQLIYLEQVKQIKQELELKVQFGGGIRDLKTCTSILEAGIDRIIIGSLAISQPEACAQIVDQYQTDRLVVAIDCKLQDDTPYIYTHGWQTKTNSKLFDVIGQLQDFGVKNFLCTDIDCDGMGQGPSFKLYQRILEQYPSINLQASGGIRSATDMNQLKQYGLSDCVVGKAFYTQPQLLADSVREFAC